MSAQYLPNNLNDTIITGNLDIKGNLSVSSQNVYLGYLAGNTNVANVDNMKNVAIGASCATYQTGSKNVSIGYDAATNGTITYSGANNVSIGYNSGFNSCSTSNGVALGVNSLVDFSGSIAIGSAATATGFRNIAIGASATSSGTASKGNSIAIGVGASTGSYGNSVAIGPGAVSTANNQITLGATNDRLAFVGMRGNYYFASNAGSSQNVYAALTTIDFNTEEDSTPSLLQKVNKNTFTNVSGRPIICIATFCICISFSTAAPFYSIANFVYNNAKYGSYILYAPAAPANAPIRISTTTILRLAVGESFSCQAGSFGNNNDGVTNASDFLTPTLSVVIF